MSDRKLLHWYILAVFLLQSSIAYSQEKTDDYVESSVYLSVPQVGGKELPALLLGEELFLPITDLFKFLRINCQLSPLMDSVHGHFMSEQDVFLVDYKNNVVNYRGKVTSLQKESLIRREDNLYLKANYFGSIFGLECVFDFRFMRVVLKAKMELPAIKEMRLEFMRRNLNNLKGELKADTIIPRKYPFFHFGNADWSIIATQRAPGGNDVRVNLGLGSIVAGGEANLILNYSSNSPFKEEQQIYHWHFANNNNKLLRQVILGKIPHGAMSTIYSPVVGAVFTNTPTTYRRSFGTFTLVEYTDPNWTVELYVNSVLVDYTKADASGFFMFNVPLVYGNSIVMLKFYGPWGEERSREKTITVPYNFLPPKTFEYTIGGGFLEDSVYNRFAKVNLNYGVSSILTISTGVEHNSSIHPANTMPFVRFALRAASSLLITGDYLFGVRVKGAVSYRLPNNLQFELNYIKFHPQQIAITNNYLEERRFVMTYPINRRKMTGLARFTIDNSVAYSNQFINSELLLSCNFQGVNGNLTTNLISTNFLNPYVYSTLAIGFKIPKGILITPQTQFDYNNTRFVMFKVECEKHFLKNATCRAIYEQNFWANVKSVQVGLRYDFPFAQAGASARFGTNMSSFIQSAKGSILLDAGNHYIGTYNRTSMGKGGLVILPFFDLNGNGHYDQSEPRAEGLNFRMSGGRVEANKRDSTYRVFDMEPFAEYFIEIEKSSFDNIAWQIKKPIINVSIDPNMFKLVEVPVSIFSEASGIVYYSDTTITRGQKRITLLFYNLNGNLVGKTMSESDGYYSLLAFGPGRYIAKVDPKQMEKLRWFSKPDSIVFEVKQNLDGDIVENLDFVLHPKIIAGTQLSPEDNNGEITEDDSLYYNLTYTYTVEVDSLLSIELAESARNYLSIALNRRVEIKEENGLFVLRIPEISGRKEAEMVLSKLLDMGIKNAVIRQEP